MWWMCSRWATFVALCSRQVSVVPELDAMVGARGVEGVAVEQPGGPQADADGHLPLVGEWAGRRVGPLRQRAPFGDLGAVDAGAGTDAELQQRPGVGGRAEPVGPVGAADAAQEDVAVRGAAEVDDDVDTLARADQHVAPVDRAGHQPAVSADLRERQAERSRL